MDFDTFLGLKDRLRKSLDIQNALAERFFVYIFARAHPKKYLRSGKFVETLNILGDLSLENG